MRAASNVTNQIAPEPPPADDVASGRGPAAAPTRGGAAAAALPIASGCAAHCTKADCSQADEVSKRRCIHI